jgi:hypothetical protein
MLYIMLSRHSNLLIINIILFNIRDVIRQITIKKNPGQYVYYPGLKPFYLKKLISKCWYV